MAARNKLHSNKSNHFSYTKELFNLIRNGENALTIHNLLQNVNVDAKDRNGYTALLLAIEFRRKDIAELLMNYGASVDAFDYLTKATMLHIVSQNGNEWLEVVQYVVKRIPDINARDRLGQTALHFAAYSKSVQIVNCLVEEGADINAKCNDDCSPLLYAAATGQRELLDQLLPTGTKFDFSNYVMPQVLHYVIYYGWADVVQSFVRWGASDLEARDDRGCAALHIASLSGHLEIVKCLVEQDVDIDAASNYGRTALHLACRKQYSNIVEYLLQANASYDNADICGNLPLYFLINTERPSAKLIKLFIEKTVDLPPAEYDAILNNSLLKVDILQDVEFCCQMIVNKHNNHDLPELYKLAVSGCLPCIKRMKITSQTEVFQAIKRSVTFEVQTKGHFNLLNMRANVLSVLCVKTVIEYCNKKQ